MNREFYKLAKLTIHRIVSFTVLENSRFDES
jgi:hypothetical protein